MAIEPGALLAGRYRADALLGRGGMGEVWRCRDAESGRDVAVKAVRRGLVADPVAARLFHAEVVATARLGHPRIVTVHDLVKDPEHGPLLVMALCPGRPLTALRPAERPWKVVHAVLCHLLEALAYAHARGVLHLDIKPENVLCHLRGGEAEATLLDFGVARIQRPGRGLRGGVGRTAMWGTLEYMAPEQCTGTFERVGPWSDLFSVGALAFELCAWRRPFPEAKDLEGLIRRAHEPAPRLLPLLPGVPPGFPDLCAALLAPDPRDRPSAAADVLAALRALGHDGAASGPMPPRSFVARPPTPAATEELAPRGSATTEVEAHEDALDDEGPAETPAGAYGLFGLREGPLQGRQEERRALWIAVRDAAAGRPRAVLLTGPAGVGKSRLARDAAERAAEQGLGAPMATAWSAGGSSDEGLRGLLENLLDSRGEAAPVVHARLGSWLDRLRAELRRRARRADEAALGAFAREAMHLLRPPPGHSPDAALPVRVAADAVALAASARPVVLRLDDVHWSHGEAFALLEALRGRGAPVAVCALCTARAEEIGDRAAFDRAAAAAGVDALRLDPLDGADTRRLLQSLLDVDDALAAALAARAEGNPLFATLLLRQLVVGEALVRRGGRHRLRPGRGLEALPADVDALLGRRLEQAGAPRRELAALALVRDRVALPVAAELARRLGERAAEAWDAALAAGLLRVEGGAYAFEHGLLREHLVRGLGPAEARALHALAAEVLATFVGREDVQEERAHHLRAAGHLPEACEALLDPTGAAPTSLSRRARLAALWAREARRIDLEARAVAVAGMRRR